MHRVRAADDFEAIRTRLAELRGERAQTKKSEAQPEPAAELPDAVAHVPSHVIGRLLARARRTSAR
jgi:hypothetical protein